MDNFIEFTCSVHLDVNLVAKVHSEVPLVIMIDPCKKCMSEVDDDLIKDRIVELIKQQLS